MAEDVQLIDERLSRQPLPNGDILEMVELTYQAVGLPPRRVFILKEKDSPTERQRVIRADLDLVSHTRPTRLTIP